MEVNELRSIVELHIDAEYTLDVEIIDNNQEIELKVTFTYVDLERAEIKQDEINNELMQEYGEENVKLTIIESPQTNNTGQSGSISMVKDTINIMVGITAGVICVCIMMAMYLWWKTTGRQKMCRDEIDMVRTTGRTTRIEGKQRYSEEQQSSIDNMYNSSTEVHDPNQHLPEYLPKLPTVNDDEDDNNEYTYTNEETDDMYRTIDDMNAETNNYGDQDQDTVQTTKGRVTRF